MFASSPSPFKVSAHEDIGLGVERRSKRRRRWKRGFQLMAWLVSIALMVWVFQGGLQWFLKTFVWSNQALALKRFQVKSQGVIPQHVLIQWTGLQPGDNLLAFHLAEIKRNLELSPFVQEASVERLFPETLRIQVQERRPIAKIRLLRPEFQEGGSIGLMSLLVDGDGVVMPMPNKEEIPRKLRLRWQQLPEIVNVSAMTLQVGQSVASPHFQAAVQWVNAFQHSILREKIHIQNVEISEKDQLIVHTQDGQRILFALNRFEAQLAKWHQVMQYGHRIGRRLSFLDLTIQNNVPIEWATEESLQAEDGHHRLRTITPDHVDV